MTDEQNTTSFWAEAQRVRAKLVSRLRNDRGSGLVSAEEDRRPLGGFMSAVDWLLLLLVQDTRNIPARMAAAGFTEDETREAWNYARQAGYTEATGLGQDRLTEGGKARAREIAITR